MFTGIITDIGQVRAIGDGPDPRFEVKTAFDTDNIELGASICCAGTCLTVIETGPDWFAVNVSAETLSKTTLGDWQVNTSINLERALCLGDELGGHLVSGHVDGVGRLVERRGDGDSLRLDFEAPLDLAKMIAAKGSITIDGVSLTVNAAAGARFGVNIVPHTQSHTTLGGLAEGDRVNLEIDLIARYVARLLEKD